MGTVGAVGAVGAVGMAGGVGTVRAAGSTGGVGTRRTGGAAGWGDIPDGGARRGVESSSGIATPGYRDGGRREESREAVRRRAAQLFGPAGGGAGRAEASPRAPRGNGPSALTDVTWGAEAGAGQDTRTTAAPEQVRGPGRKPAARLEARPEARPGPDPGRGLRPGPEPELGPEPGRGPRPGLWPGPAGRTAVRGLESPQPVGAMRDAVGWTSDGPATAPAALRTPRRSSGSSSSDTSWSAPDRGGGVPGPVRPEGVPARSGTVPAEGRPVPAEGPVRAAAAGFERLRGWLYVRCGMEFKTAAALTLVLVVAAGFAVHHFWAGRPRTLAVPTRLAAAGMDAGPVPGAGPGGAPATGGRADEPRVSARHDAVRGTAVTVDVAGKVRRPGIRRLPGGARVADALRAAGGALPGTDTSGVNLARVLADGEQILVGVPAQAASPLDGGSGGGGPTAPIGLNAATAEQLETLPGVGPVLARHILEYRTQHGGFRSVEDLRNVTGIGDRRFADLRPLVQP